MNTEIYKNKLEQIASSIYGQVDLYPKEYGLFCGKGGLVLFLYYYYTYTANNKYKNRAEELLEEIFGDINKDKQLDITYAEGITGIYNMLYHLKLENIPTNFILEHDDKLEDIIFQACIYSINSRNFDFLYGSAGWLWSLFIKYQIRPTQTTYIRILQIIDNIYIQMKKNKDLFAYWNREEGVLNLGMAHGIASWISILSSLWMIGIKSKAIVYILNLLVEYYTPFIDIYGSKSIFPCDYNINEDIRENDIFSRLGWCYGDITCLISLLKFCIITNNKSLSDKLKYRLLNETIFRKDLQDNRIFDASICHGSAGIAYLYNTIYNYHVNSDLYKSSMFWYEKTIDFSSENKDCAGYKMYYKTSTGEFAYRNDMGLLEGIAGIGLSLLSFICPKFNKWGLLLGL